MSVYEPTWSYGISKLFNSSGIETNPDYAWSYGINQFLHEIWFPLNKFTAEHVDIHFIAEDVDTH